MEEPPGGSQKPKQQEEELPNVDDPEIVQLIEALRSCHLFDDPARKAEIQITLADLQQLLRDGQSVAFVEEMMATWEAQGVRFTSLPEFQEAMRLAVHDSQSQAEVKEIVSDLKRLDPCFPEVINILTSCQLFDEVPSGSVDISVDQLLDLLSIAKEGRYLVASLQELVRSPTRRLGSVAELADQIRLLSKQMRRRSRREARAKRSLRSASRGGKAIGGAPQSGVSPRSSFSEDNANTSEVVLDAIGPNSPTDPAVPHDLNDLDTPNLPAAATGISPLPDATAAAAGDQRLSHHSSASSSSIPSSRLGARASDLAVAKTRIRRNVINAGGSFTHTVTVPGTPSSFGTHISWYFKESYGYDIDFTVHCDAELVKDCPRSPTNKGFLETKPNEACTVIFTWNNEYSWLNSKDVEWFIFVFTPLEAEEREEEERLSRLEKGAIGRFQTALAGLEEELAPQQEVLAGRRAAARSAWEEAKRMFEEETAAIDEEVATAVAKFSANKEARLDPLIAELEALGRGNPDRLKRRIAEVRTSLQAT